MSTTRAQLDRRARAAAMPRESRAFAMAMVMMLAIIAGLTASVMIEQHGMARLAARRQVNSYTSHHRRSGIQEMVAQWIPSSSAQLVERIGAGGPVFSMDLPDNAWVQVALEDGQGTILADLSTIGIGIMRTRSQEALREIFRTPETIDGLPTMRREGPPSVSVNGAPEEVLLAVIQGALNSRQAGTAGSSDTIRADDLVREILDARADQPLTRPDLRRLLQEAGARSTDLVTIESMLTAEPTLWRVKVRFKGSGLGEGRAEGVMLLRSGTVNFSRSSPFLTWKEWLEPVER